MSNLLCDGNVTSLWLVTLTASPAIVNANTTAEQTFTIKGLNLSNDFIIGVSKPTAQAGLSVSGGRVTAADTVGITFGNFTGTGITPTAGQNYHVLIARREKIITNCVS